MSSEKVDEQPNDLAEKLNALQVDEEVSEEAKPQAESKNETRPRQTYEERVALMEEELKKKKVLETGLTGVVRWYSVRGRYGFVERTDGGKDIFVHQTAISKSHTEKFYYRTLATGEKVAFDVVEGHSGPEAANVTGPDGAKVKGFGYRAPRNGTRHRKNSRRSVDQDEKKKENVEGDGEKVVKKNRHRKVNDKAKGADKAVEAKDDAENGTAEAKGDAELGTASPTTTSC